MAKNASSRENATLAIAVRFPEKFSNNVRNAADPKTAQGVKFARVSTVFCLRLQVAKIPMGDNVQVVASATVVIVVVVFGRSKVCYIKDSFFNCK